MTDETVPEIIAKSFTLASTIALGIIMADLLRLAAVWCIR